MARRIRRIRIGVQVGVISPFTIYSNESRTIIYNYDNRNRLASITDPLGKRTNFTHEGAGNLVKKVTPNRVTSGFSRPTMPLGSYGRYSIRKEIASSMNTTRTATGRRCATDIQTPAMRSIALCSSQIISLTIR